MARIRRHQGPLARSANRKLSPEPRSRPPVLRAVATVIAAFALRVYGIGGQEIWYDEAFSFHMATIENPFGYILYDYNPPLYYVLLRGWVAIAGHTETALRLLSACFGTAFVGCVLWAGLRLFNWRVALWSGLVAAAAPIHIYYSQEARGYALLLTALLACYVCSGLALEDRNARSWALAAGCALVALYTHYFAIFALAPLSALFLTRKIRRDRRQLALSAAAAASVVVLYLPWLWWRFVADGPGAPRAPDYGWRLAMWEATHPLLAIPRSLEIFLLGGDSSLPLIFLKQLGRIEYPAALRYVGLGALVIMVLVLVAPWGERGLGVAGMVRRKGVLAVLAAAPLVVMWLISFYRPIYLTARYDLVAFPAFVLLVGLALAKLQSAGRTGGVLVVGLAAALGTAMAVKLALYYRAEPERTQAITARGLDTGVRSGDAVVFTRVRGVTVLYYLRRLGYSWEDGVCRGGAGQKEFLCRMFPRASERTLVSEPERALEAPDTIRDEVRALVAALAPDNAVWVVFGEGSIGDGRFIPSEIDAVLMDELIRSGYTPAEADAGPAVFRFQRS